MAVYFNNLFEHFNQCRNHQRILISKTQTPGEDATEGLGLKIKVKRTGIWPFSRNSKKTRKENRETIEEFTKIVTLYAQNGESPIVKKVLEELHTIKSDGSKLTAGKVRSVYKKLVSQQLEGARKVAAVANLKDRIVYLGGAFKVQNVAFSSLRKKHKKANRETIDQFYQSLVNEWGEKRVDRSLNHMWIDLEKMGRKGTALRAKTVHQVMLGIADYRKEDLENCHKKILEGGKSLPAREKRILKEHFNVQTDEELKEKLASFFSKEKELEELDEEQYQLLQKATFLSEKELELSLNGTREEGVAKGALPLNTIKRLFRNLFYSRAQENRSRLELYLKLHRLDKIAPKETLETAYDELLTKGVVKKELEEGMMVPGIKVSGKLPWYQVEKKILTKRGKLAYHLVQSNKHETMDEILMYRSTASPPAFTDSSTTILTDAWPGRPPGYLWGRKGDKIEKKILHSSNHPIRIIGHSLGGVHAQLALCHRIINQKGKLIDELPDRKIKIRAFDAPALRKKEVRKFAEWIEKPEYAQKAKNLSLELKISHKDAVPSIGDYHLGFEAKRENLGHYSAKYLTPINKNKPGLKLHPHEKQYYQTTEGVDYTSEDLEIDTFDKKVSNIALEIIRKIIGALIFVITLPFTLISRVFVGVRGDQPGVKRVFKKYYPRLKNRLKNKPTLAKA